MERDQLLPAQKRQAGGKMPLGTLGRKEYVPPHFPIVSTAPPLQRAHNEGGEEESKYKAS